MNNNIYYMNQEILKKQIEENSRLLDALLNELKASAAELTDKTEKATA